jgi:hypothetical protein
MYVLDITTKAGGRKEYVGRDSLPSLPAKGDVVQVEDTKEMAYVKAVQYCFRLEKSQGGHLGEVSFHYPRIWASE